MSITLDTQLDNKWTLWIHQSKNNWTINGFNNLYTINTIKDFWTLHNSWEVNGGIHLNNYFLMKDDIQPLWECAENKKGGCWSFKVKDTQSQELWNDISTFMISGNLSENMDDINGLSITKKKNGWIIIKIWNKNNKNSSLKNINYEILKKWGLEVIYISHLSS
ncbi:putative eIF-4E [Cafeteria roenbergensis virus]|uniref:Putative eIF-4E n=1 Tax=Cafeteria roenbergensis virus (strain BV-PW1) TaxID=693272 RepID=E3T4Z0_CROVB|nr:putative eIF-4E [Cafeteria roenbergensis virus BV-PW1]ADO67253.1 putative eIF-4E [Cafeteria roenbergensis virus BV-PW1]